MITEASDLNTPAPSRAMGGMGLLMHHHLATLWQLSVKGQPATMAMCLFGGLIWLATHEIIWGLLYYIRKLCNLKVMFVQIGDVSFLIRSLILL